LGIVKIFYTERDIDDLKRRGVDHIDVNENVVLTDLAVERALRHGIKLNRSGNSITSELELKQKVKSVVLARLNGQVDEALLDAVITRVLAGMR